MIKWTIESIKNDALKYNTKKEWKNNSNPYFAAQRHGIINDCSKHMFMLIKPKGYWSIENIKKDALKYKTKVDWFNSSRSSYSLASRKGILNMCTKHMISNNNGWFTIYVFEFPDNSYYVGLTRRKHERFNEHINNNSSPVYQHIKNTNLTPIYKILFDDIVYENDASNKEKEYDDYYQDNNWNRLNKAPTGSLGSLKNKKWTKNKIKEEALKFNSKKEWYSKSPKSYDAAQRYNLIDEYSNHMIQQKKPKGYWSYDNIKNEALKYKSKMEWKNNSNGSYSIACKKGILIDCTKHMK